jgi:secondary thiamine-phosphate synthase enzyme
MKLTTSTLTVATRGPGLTDITGKIAAWLAAERAGEGQLTVFLRHTSASLVIQENADPDVRTDLERFFSRLVPRGDPLYRHTVEGPDDMPAHVRTALTATSLSLPIVDGAPALGTWQGIYLWEHRDAPHSRRIAAHVLGE